MAFVKNPDLPEGLQDHNIYNKIVYVIVNFGEQGNLSTQVTFADGVWIFPNETMLRSFMLGRENVIWLQTLVEPKCKKCHGKGDLGIRYNSLNINRDALTFAIKNVLDCVTLEKPGAMEETAEAAIQEPEAEKKQSDGMVIGLLCKLPFEMTEPLDALLKVAKEDFLEALSDNPLDELTETIKLNISKHYAKIIMQDFKIQEILFCDRCYLRNLDGATNVALDSIKPYLKQTERPS
jgi:hypothetical protein